MKTGAFTYPVNRVRCIKMKDGITVFKPILLHTQHFSIFFFFGIHLNAAKHI